MTTRNTTDPHRVAVCMGMDALRICIGRPPRSFSAAEVVRWITLMSKPPAHRVDATKPQCPPEGCSETTCRCW